MFDFMNKDKTIQKPKNGRNLDRALQKKMRAHVTCHVRDTALTTANST